MSQLRIKHSSVQIYFSTLIQLKFHTDIVGKLQSDTYNTLQLSLCDGIQLQAIYVEKVGMQKLQPFIENIFIDSGLELAHSMLSQQSPLAS